MDIKEQIAASIASVLGIGAEQVMSISGDDTLNRIGVDSVNFVEIIINIEDNFNIAFQDDELLLQNLNTLNKLNTIIRQKLGMPEEC